MNETSVDKIARAVLYEGYILYPYRPSMKNRQRWTFGGLYPEDHPLAREGREASSMQAQCLVRAEGQRPLEVKARFLHLQMRTVGELAQPLAELPRDAEPTYRSVESLEVAGQRYQSWQEAVEREVALEPMRLDALLDQPWAKEFMFPRRRETEALAGAEGKVEGMLVREQEALAGRVVVRAQAMNDGLFQVTATVVNHTPWEKQAPVSRGASAPSEADSDGRLAQRDQALMRSLASTHMLLGVAGGEFVSLTDPPDACREAAGQCQNLGVWPVLVGEEKQRDTMLASPIILYDHPRIAPESPGDYFDGTEIDEMLSLRIMTLTDEEKQAMASVDERAKALLERTETLARDQLMGLHGAVRGLKPVEEQTTGAAGNWHQPWNPLQEKEQDGPEQTKLGSVRVGGHELAAGDRVRLRPLGRADIFDIALSGMTATIEDIEQDYENRVYLAVTIDEDPGRDLGDQRLPGHRFFFGVEEVEPLTDEPQHPGDRHVEADP